MEAALPGQPAIVGGGVGGFGQTHEAVAVHRPEIAAVETIAQQRLQPVRRLGLRRVGGKVMADQSLSSGAATLRLA